MEITKDKAVTVEYTLRGEGGQIIDTSRGRGPLTYIHGMGSMIPGFEAALEGKQAKDSLSFTVAAAQGYGERDDNMLFPIPREQFQGIENLEVGLQLQVRTPQGAVVMRVAEIDEATVTLDANHPLAGVPLFFEVEVLDVRDATQAELDGASGCGSESCSPSCCDSCGSGCSE